MAEQKYWPHSGMTAGAGGKFELRSSMAAILIEKWGMVAGKPGGEDSSGRRTLDILSPEEVVERAYAVADLLVDTAEKRGELVLETDEDVSASFQRVGELERIRSEARCRL